jgi:hypothetical protein
MLIGERHFPGEDQAMIGMTSALIGLAAYFFALFVFGLLWKRREASQKLRKEKAAAGPPFSPHPSQRGEYAHLG